MMLADRGLVRVMKAAVRPRPYVAAYNMTRGLQAPASWLYKYISGAGGYPTTALVKLPSGARPVRLWSHHDLLTMNEIYFRRDYHVEGHEQTIVDFGSNIGISALYFLDFAPNAHVYLFEPLSTNIERLNVQLAGLEERYTLTKTAVGTEDGLVEFGIEHSGRYGGIGKSLAGTIQVQCRNANAILANIIRDRGIIDLLKIDIEGAERSVVENMSHSVSSKILKVYAEAKFPTNPLSETHELTQCGSIATFSRRSR